MIEAVRNRKSGKYFIILDESLDSRYKLLGPAGDVLNLAAHLFDDEMVCVPVEEYEKHFTPRQLTAYEKQSERIAAQIERIQAVTLEEARASQAEAVKPAIPRKPSIGGTRRKAQAKVSTKTGLGAEWNSPKLTFYRHKIQGLAPKQSFRIHVDGSGTYEFTKDEFQRVFNDVVMSPKYLRDGLFAYDKLPEKAVKFRKP